MLKFTFYRTLQTIAAIALVSTPVLASTTNSIANSATTPVPANITLAANTTAAPTTPTNPNNIVLAANTKTATATAQTEASPTPAPVAEAPVATPAITQPSGSDTPTLIPTAPNLGANGYVLMDAATGMIIAHKNMHEKMQPASLTKLMTLYLTFNALQNGQIHLNDEVRISENAWKTGGSRMFLKEGSTATVQQLIDGIIVASGNDACVALAQYVGGNQATFVQMMNAEAKRLGMKGTHYVDPTGLPIAGHHSTPYDMALLTHAIIENFPAYYPFFKQGWINYNGIKQPNRNRLLWEDPSVDGLKTGHTEEAGYCLISSALRHGMRLISVVMGAPTDSERQSDSEALLNWGFRFYQTHKLFDANKALANPRVLYGKNKSIPIGLSAPLFVTIPTGTYTKLKPEVAIPGKLQAPIKEGQVVGTLNIHLENTVVTSVPLIALKGDRKGSVITRLWDRLSAL